MQVGRKVYFKERSEWRRWLAAHHDTTREIWLVLFRKSSKKPSLTYDAAVEEALCYGWIDSMEKSLNRERYVLRFTPRKPGSTLSPLNQTRIRVLNRRGKMTRAGRAAIARVVRI